MTRVFCDICGAERNDNLQIREKQMITRYAASEWQKRGMDVCEDCLKKLEYLHGLVEEAFVNGKGKVNIKIEDE